MKNNEKKIKILVQTFTISRKAGGLFTSVRKLSYQSLKIGNSVSISCYIDEFTSKDQKDWGDFDVFSFNKKGLKIFPISINMLRGTMNNNFDIIHTHGIWSFQSLIELINFKRKRTPYIISPRGMLDPWALQNSAWKKKVTSLLFENKHLANAKCLHALCDSEATSMRKLGLKNPIAIIPNGIDLPDLESIETQHVNNGKTKRLLFLGRIHPKKGIKELIHAWYEYRNKFIGDLRWELLIAGWDDGNHLKELTDLASSLDLDKSIKFVGPVFGSDKDDLLKNVDCFILPSFSEGLPMAILEAWAYKLPVIMTEECNIPEGFSQDAAIKIAPTVESIAKSLLQLHDLESVRLHEIGINGRHLVEKKFTWDKIGTSMDDVYQWCVTGKNPPSCLKFYSE